MITTLTGYTYQIEQDAINSVELCNQYYNIPVNGTEITQNWCAYYQYSNFWYISYNPSLLPVLGQPIEFEIEFNDV